MKGMALKSILPSDSERMRGSKAYYWTSWLVAPKGINTVKLLAGQASESWITLPAQNSVSPIVGFLHLLDAVLEACHRHF